MIFMHKFLAMTIILLAYKNGPAPGLAIKCHVCNSKEDTACVDPFNVSTTLQDCSGGGGRPGGGRTLDVIEIIMQSLDGAGGASGAETPSDAAGVETAPPATLMVCQKIVVIVGNESITGRGCSPHLVDGMHPCDAVKLSTPGASAAAVLVRHCVTCPRDACNAVGGVALSPATLLPALAAALLRSFHHPQGI